MTVLSRVRFIAFLVLLTAAMVSSPGPVLADDDCNQYGPCDDCDTPVGRCYIPTGGGACEQYVECTTVGLCSSSGGPSGTICDCGPCQD
jgi:hypothetical protein